MLNIKSLKSIFQKIKTFEENFSKKNGHKPTLNDFSKHLRISKEKMEVMLRLVDAPLSLAKPAYENEYYLGEGVDLFPRTLLCLLQRKELDDILAVLSDIEPKFLRLYLGIEQGGKSLEEIGNLLNIPYEKVVLLRTHSVRKLLKYQRDEKIQLEINIRKHEADGENVLIIASRNGLTEAVINLLNAGANIEVSDAKGWTPLMVASYNGHIDIVEELLKRGASVNATNPKGWNSLILASRNGHVKIVQELIKAGADVNAKNEEGETALMHACESGHVETVRELIKAGASINYTDTIEGATSLMIASQNGHTEIVRELVKMGANVNIVDTNGLSALTLAKNNGHMEIIKLLEQTGANPLNSVTSQEKASAEEKKSKLNKDTSKKFTEALISAVISNDVKKTKELLESGADVNAKDPENGNTPLIEASTLNYTELVQYLTTVQGVDLNATNNKGNTALHEIVWTDLYYDTLKILVSAGADVNARNKKDETVLMHAIKPVNAKGDNRQIIDLLTSSGIDLETKNPNNQTALDIAIQKESSYCVEKIVLAGALLNPSLATAALKVVGGWASEEFISKVINAGADVNVRLWHKGTALMDARNPNIVRMLISAGADVNARNDKEETPLIHVCKNTGTKVEVVQELIAGGADVDAQSIDGNTALINAVSLNMVKIIKALLLAKADVNIQNKKGKTAVVYACTKEIADLISGGVKDNTAEIPAQTNRHSDVKGDKTSGRNKLEEIEKLINASFWGRTEEVQALIKSGVDVNGKDEDGWTALMRACTKNRVEIVKILLEKGADVNARNNDGATALQCTSTGRVETLEILLQAGADVNAKNDEGETALMSASSCGYINIVQALLKAGADVNAKNSKGETALMGASLCGQATTAQDLLQAGADVNAKDQDNGTALTRACWSGNVKIVRMLIQAGADISGNVGETALEFAIENDYPEVVKVLQQAKADLNAKNNRDKSQPLSSTPGYSKTTQKESTQDQTKTVLVNVIVGLVLATVFIFFAWLGIQLAILLFPVTVIIIVISVFAVVFRNK